MPGGRCWRPRAAPAPARPDALRGQPHGVALRLGLHTGPVVVGPLGTTRSGPTPRRATPSLATRLQHQAAPDTLLVSAATYALVQDEVQGEAWEDPGLDAAVHPGARYAGARPPAAAGGCPTARCAAPESPLWAGPGSWRCCTSGWRRRSAGRGRSWASPGSPAWASPGCWRSLPHSLDGQPVTYCEGHCLAYGSATPYLPVRDLLRQLWGLPDRPPLRCHHRHHPAAAVRGRGGVRGRGRSCSSSSWTCPWTWRRWPRSSPQERQARTFAVLRHLIRHASQRQPLVLAVENLHWIDPTSEEWLALVERLGGDMPMLLLATYRPGYQPPWLGHSGGDPGGAAALSSHDSLVVLQSVPQAAQLPPRSNRRLWPRRRAIPSLWRS